MICRLLRMILYWHKCATVCAKSMPLSGRGKLESLVFLVRSQYFNLSLNVLLMRLQMILALSKKIKVMLLLS